MFGTSGIRGRVGESVTAAVALSVGRAVGADADRVVVGRDARQTGDTLQGALMAGLRETGVDVVDIGRAATPTVARSIGARSADAGIIITASHNPPQDNGLKLWTLSGQAFSPEQQTEIEARIETEAYELADWTGQGGYESWDNATEHHTDALVATGRQDAAGADVSLSSLSVVVDLGNGMGGVSADALFELGADVETINAQQDGRFPGRPSEPTVETCTTLAATVDAVDADIGIAHDGDADRMMAVTDEGEFIPGDMLLAIFGQEIAKAGDRIAAPVDTSLAVTDAFAEFGAELVHTRVGDVYVAQRASDDDVVFGGEPSGAWIFPEETLCPDGPLAAVKLAVLGAVEPLSARLERIDRYPIKRTVVETTDKTEAMARISATVRQRYDDVTTLDGVRVDSDSGWFLIRPSGTEPKIRVTAEAREAATTDELLEQARELVETELTR
ncbi:phosphoglucosamine mutase [Haloarcula sp. CBA1130]|uniref:phosphoglucosamine mutase n=1 Tax=unclassified Haloarcula TaxID=2624677 RepID=UPI00124804C9|nr:MULTISPECIES: phosphoglucosamine mutase [unclassified Haloarcula]KAA9396686.1 phosphoglucosamine mutase [Haloarcula sp. CBA1130]KAA9397665.1 phosphoglucosamine mutase [Haloarcula sp. CBA1129]